MIPENLTRIISSLTIMSTLACGYEELKPAPNDMATTSITSSQSVGGYGGSGGAMSNGGYGGIGGQGGVGGEDSCPQSRMYELKSQENWGSSISNVEKAVSQFPLDITDDGYSLTFETAEDVVSFLPSEGTPTELTQYTTNPAPNTAGGSLGGEAVALKLNQWNNNAVAYGGSPTNQNYNNPFNFLVLTNTGTKCDGWLLRDIVTASSESLSGMLNYPGAYITPAEAKECAKAANEAFHYGNCNLE